MSVKEAEWQHKSGLILGTLFIHAASVTVWVLSGFTLLGLFAFCHCVCLSGSSLLKFRKQNLGLISLIFFFFQWPFPTVLMWDLRTNQHSLFFCLGIVPIPPLNAVTFLVCLPSANYWRWRLWSHSLRNKASVKLKKTELLWVFIGICAELIEFIVL